MVPKRKMNKINWLVMCSGIFFTIVGYFLVAPITRDYETPRAFFAILVLNIGLLTTISSLSFSFEKSVKKEN